MRQEQQSAVLSASVVHWAVYATCLQLRTIAICCRSFRDLNASGGMGGKTKYISFAVGSTTLIVIPSAIEIPAFVSTFLGSLKSCARNAGSLVAATTTSKILAASLKFDASAMLHPARKLLATCRRSHTPGFFEIIVLKKAVMSRVDRLNP